MCNSSNHWMHFYFLLFRISLANNEFAVKRNPGKEQCMHIQSHARSLSRNCTVISNLPPEITLGKTYFLIDGCWCFVWLQKTITIINAGRYRPQESCKVNAEAVSHLQLVHFLQQFIKITILGDLIGKIYQFCGVFCRFYFRSINFFGLHISNSLLITRADNN